MLNCPIIFKIGPLIQNKLIDFQWKFEIFNAFLECLYSGTPQTVSVGIPLIFSLGILQCRKLQTILKEFAQKKWRIPLGEFESKYYKKYFFRVCHIAKETSSKGCSRNSMWNIFMDSLGYFFRYLWGLSKAVLKRMLPEIPTEIHLGNVLQNFIKQFNENQFLWRILSGNLGEFLLGFIGELLQRFFHIFIKGVHRKLIQLFMVISSRSLREISSEVRWKIAPEIFIGFSLRTLSLIFTEKHRKFLQKILLAKFLQGLYRSFPRKSIWKSGIHWEISEEIYEEFLVKFVEVLFQGLKLKKYELISNLPRYSN